LKSKLEIRYYVTLTRVRLISVLRFTRSILACSAYITRDCNLLSFAVP